LRLQGSAVLLDLHEAMPEILAARFRLAQNSLWVRVAAFVEQLSCRFANHVIVANDGIRAAVVARGTPANRVTAVYNPGPSGTGRTDTDDIAREYKLPPCRLLVHAGGINPERDLETLFKALARITPRLNIVLVLAGDGEPGYVASLEQLARSLGIHERVRFLGKLSQERALALMSLAEVGVITLEANPLTALAWPSRVTEFAQMRKPLVVPRLPFLHKTLEGGAQYYEPGDPASLAHELEIALNDPGKSAEGVAQAEAISRRFEWTRMRDVLRHVYRTAEAARGP
jgi:glycosyltransferase involved in cell wall biosynthesis